MTLEIDGSRLCLADMVAVARNHERVRVSLKARAKMQAARQVVEEALADDAQVYGLTTGVAERKRAFLGQEDRSQFSRSLISTHRVAQGRPAPEDVTRGTMLCLANSLAKGAAGVRPTLVELIVELLNDGYTPPVRRLGSVGQADLGQMADLAHGILERSGFELAEGEGLALVDNNAFATAWCGLALADAEQMLECQDVAAALDLEGFQANLSILHPIIDEMRRHPGLVSSLERLRALLEGSYLYEEGAPRNLQDPLTFRCIPQIHGAARETLNYARALVETELNSSQGNPIVVTSERRVISVGNFDIGPVAAAIDFVRIAFAPVVTSANERAVKLLQSPFSGLAPGLAAGTESGQDGLAELAVACQGIAAEARTLAHPVSVNADRKREHLLTQFALIENGST